MKPPKLVSVSELSDVKAAAALATSFAMTLSSGTSSVASFTASLYPAHRDADHPNAHRWAYLTFAQSATTANASASPSISLDTTACSTVVAPSAVFIYSRTANSACARTAQDTGRHVHRGLAWRQ